MKEKNNLLPLWIAGGSILFVSAAMPLIDSVVTWISSAINAHINRIDLELDQREAQAAAETIKPSPQMTHAIGFDVNPEPEYEDDDYE